MATAYTPNDHHQIREVSALHIKREPTEDSREHYERSMEMSHYQASNGHLDPSRHQGAPNVYGMDYSPYPYDQRVVNPLSPYPQQQYSHQREDPCSPDSYHNQELKNYVLHNGIPSGMHQNGHAVSDTEQADPDSDIPVLKIKRSNGKLALPEILRSNGTKGIDLISLTTHQRAKREFVPDNKKDEGYWNKRVKNNDSARRSRVKRKALEKIMETRLVELQQENIELRHEMNALKRRFGIMDETTPTSPSYGNLKGSLDSVLNGLNSSSPEKLSKEDELEQQSSASDDSRSLDDARSCYNVRSVSALSQSLDPANRDRADSLGSDGSSAAHRSPNSSNSNSPPATWEYSYVKTDQSGALDLTSDFSARAPHPKDYHPSSEVVPSSGDMDTFHSNGSDKMRGIPLKCRWKYSSTSLKNTTDPSASFPGA